MPNRRASKAVHHHALWRATWLGIKELTRRLGGFFHFLRRTLPYPFGLAVAIDFRRKNRRVTCVDIIANCLADQMVANRIASEIIGGQQCPFLGDIVRLIERGVDIEVVTPAGEFDAVEAHLFDVGREFGEWEISPLAGKKCDGT